MIALPSLESLSLHPSELRPNRRRLVAVRSGTGPMNRTPPAETSPAISRNLVQARVIVDGEHGPLDEKL